MNNTPQIGLKHDGHPLTLDVSKLVETRLLAVANSGGGKSHLLRKLLEVSHGKVQQIVLDVEGDFASLREKYDFILAGKGGDIPADPRLAEMLAHKVLELGASIIIDLYELKHHDRIRFVRLFLEAMVNAPKELWHPALIVIDEAHLFCPEKGEAESMEAVVDIATRGRKRGFSVILATQRLSKLHKDAAAECINKLIGRTGLDIDMKRAADELGFSSKAQALSLRDLEPGEFFAFGPALSREISKVKVGATATTHPKAGSRASMKAPVPTEKIRGILSKLSDLPQQAEADLKDKASLMARVRELEGKLRQVPKAEVSKEDFEKAVQSQVAKARAELLAKARTNFQKVSNTIKNQVADRLTDLVVNLFDGYEVPKSPVFVPPTPPRKELGQAYGGGGGYAPLAPKLGGFMPKTKPTVLGPTSFDSEGLGKCHKAILAFLVSRGQPMTKVQIGAITGYAPNGGGFNNAIGKLGGMGLVVRSGEKLYVPDTAAGQVQEILGPDFKSPGPDALNDWIGKLKKCEAEVFKFLKGQFPDVVTRELLAEGTGYEVGGGGFNNAIGRLCTLGLAIRTGGGIQLNPEVGNL